VYARTKACMNTNLHASICLHAYIADAFIYARTHVCMFASNISLLECMHICEHVVRIYICMHIHTDVCSHSHSDSHSHSHSRIPIGTYLLEMLVARFLALFGLLLRLCLSRGGVYHCSVRSLLELIVTDGVWCFGMHLSFVCE